MFMQEIEGVSGSKKLIKFISYLIDGYLALGWRCKDGVWFRCCSFQAPCMVILIVMLIILLGDVKAPASSARCSISDPTK